MAPRLTVYYIVEPPDYQVMACYLSASLREQFGDTVALVGYCPAAKIDLVHPEVKAVLAKLGCDLRTFEVEGRFTPAYPHGNKILATLEPRDTEFSCFMDSDVLCIKPNDVANIVMAGHVSLTPAASMGWGKQSAWDAIYAAADMDKPTDRVRLMKQKNKNDKMPYFSSGLFSFPEQYRTPEGKSFPQVWMEVAQVLDAKADVPSKRPYLDQMSLPLAIRKAGLDWNILPDVQHFILGGRVRGDPLPADRDVYTVHYRQWPVLKEIGLAGVAKQMLEKQAGLKKLDMSDGEAVEKPVNPMKGLSPEDKRAAKEARLAAKSAKADDKVLKRAARAGRKRKTAAPAPVDAQQPAETAAPPVKKPARPKKSPPAQG